VVKGSSRGLTDEMVNILRSANQFGSEGRRALCLCYEKRPFACGRSLRQEREGAQVKRERERERGNKERPSSSEVQLSKVRLGVELGAGAEEE
jgi:hypothetical protein